MTIDTDIDDVYDDERFYKYYCLKEMALTVAKELFGEFVSVEKKEYHARILNEIDEELIEKAKEDYDGFHSEYVC